MQKRTSLTYFIEKERAKGTSSQDIRRKLLEAGWQMDIIQNAMGKEINTISSALGFHPKSSKVKSVRYAVVVVIVIVLVALFI